MCLKVSQLLIFSDVNIQAHLASAVTSVLALYWHKRLCVVQYCRVQANSVMQNEVAVDRWLHRFIIGPKGANIKQITQDFPRVCPHLLVCSFLEVHFKTYQHCDN